MREIQVCPSLLVDGFSTYCPKASRMLFDGRKVSPWLDFNIEDELHTELAQRNMQNLSISGAQEKLAAVIDGGRIRLAKEGEQSTHILKPAPMDMVSLRKQIPMNEHLTMQIASQVYGIPTAANGLCFSADGQPVYITRRFDVQADGTKMAQEDFCSLIGRTEQTDGAEFKYEGSYEDIAKAIRKYVPAWMPAMERFFKLLVFDYIFANGDAHLKNFSVLYVDGEPMLAPAYDLINTFVHLQGSDLGLKEGLSPSLLPSDSLERTGHPCQDDFRCFGLLIGLPPKRVERVLALFMELPVLVHQLIQKSFLFDDSTRRKYSHIVEERVKRFARAV